MNVRRKFRKGVNMFRRVQLPGCVPGNLYLHSMPGRWEPFQEAKAIIKERHIGTVVCLTPMDEILEKSPEYAKAIQTGALPFVHRMFEIPDYDVPKDREAFLALARSIAMELQLGKHVLIHCGAGKGRTGTLAICVLMALGLEEDKAWQLVREAHSNPETPAQRELVKWAAIQLKS